MEGLKVGRISSAPPPLLGLAGVTAGLTVQEFTPLTLTLTLESWPLTRKPPADASWNFQATLPGGLAPSLLSKGMGPGGGVRRLEF